MGSFQVCSALNTFFKLEKPPIEHLEGFIILPKKGDKLHNFIRIFDQKFQFKNSKESPTGSTKVSALMVGRMFVIVTMNC
jgi:hypothetical protein